MKKLVFKMLFLAIIFASIGQVLALDANEVYKKSSVRIYINGNAVEFERDPIEISYRTLVPIEDTFSELNSNINLDSTSNIVNIMRNNTTIRMKIGENTAVVNGKKIIMDVSPVMVRGTVMVPLRFVSEKFNINLEWDSVSRTIFVGTKGSNVSRGDSDKKFTVVIDAGHGGKETGAIYGRVKEKDLNLAIAKRLNALLKTSGIRTYMTRDKDVYLGLYKRSDLANKVNADLLISIHNNAGYKRESGSMSLYYPSLSKSKGDLTPREFASIVQKNLNKSLKTYNKGVISRPHLAVLRTSDVPSVIAEIGYMTNSKELGKLKTASYQQKAAQALRDAVIQALNEI